MPDATTFPAPARPGFSEAFRFWLNLGCISFGGPAGQIAIMQTELVDRRRWIDQGRFLAGLNFCTLLPGPEAMQLATYIGWRLHGIYGGLAAGILFVVPGALVLLLLSWLAAAYGDAGPVAAMFYGLKPVVIAIVAHALWRIGMRTIRTWQAAMLAVGAFVAISILGIDFPWIVLAAGLIGWVASQAGHGPFASMSHSADESVAAVAPRDAPRGGMRHILGVVALSTILWAVPVGHVLGAYGTVPYGDIASLFTKAAFVTFGGAYAVLPYVADEAVNTYGWLSPGDMLDGLALAETTPGPLILVLQYVGFFAGWNNAGAHDPLVAGTIAAALTTYVTFLPSFLFIFAAAPYIDRLHAIPAAGLVLGAITAAVVVVILNLAVFLGQGVIFPAPGIVDWFAIAVALVALAVMTRWTVEIHWLVAAGAMIGLVHGLAIGRIP